MSKKKILIVEDDENSLLFIQYNLEIAGYDVVTAEDGVEGLSQTREHNPDLIISDIMMPKMDGYEFCHQLKSNPQTAHIPFVFLSAKGMVSERVRGMRMGAQDFIAKPFNPEELVTRVAVILQTLEDQKHKYNSVNEGLKGSLTEMEMTDLLQMLKLGRKTGTLNIRYEDYEGKIFFKDGVPLKAYCGVLDDEKAIFRMMYWDKGQFTFEPGLVEVDKTINMKLENILLEGSRLTDELKKDFGELLPNPESYFVPNPFTYQDDWEPTPAEEQILSLIELGLNWGKISELSTLGDYETAKAVANLMLAGFLEKEGKASDNHITRNIASSLRNILKLAIQLERRNSIKTEFQGITFATLYKVLRDQHVGRNIFSIAILATEENLIKIFLGELGENQPTSTKHQAYLGKIETKDFLLNLIAIPVIKRFEMVNNFLLRLSTGKIIVLDGIENQQLCLGQLKKIETNLFDQHNREHSIVLIQKAKGSELDCTEKVRVEFLKSQEVDVEVQSYDRSNPKLIFEAAKKVLYTFLPG